jgi:DNA-binding LytR/AlgR family response regulator
MGQNRSIFVEVKDLVWEKINIDEITHIKEIGNSSLIYRSEGGLIKSCKKMQDIQQALPIEFERVHKAYIVNMHYVDTVCLKTNTINMKFDCSIKIGLAHKKNIAKYMKIS